MDRSSLNTFNSAKKFAEEILHELMLKHDNARIVSMIGAGSIEESIKLRPLIRIMNKFNAMKERIVFQQTLVINVLPIVRLNNNKTERKILEEILDNLYNLEEDYENKSDKVLIEGDEKLKTLPKLTLLFVEIRRNLDRYYMILCKIMHKNKLIFSGNDDEFADNEDLMERIKSENRNL